MYASIVNGDAIDGQHVKEKGRFLERCGRIWQEVPEQVVIVRSHTHGSYRSYTECGFTAMSTPAWKLQDAFVARPWALARRQCNRDR